MAEREAKNAAKGACAQIDSKTSHDVIRAQTSPIPVRSKIEETALGQFAQECGRFGIFGGTPDLSGGDRHRRTPVLSPALQRR
jgi:hypothetical protein